MDNMQLEKERGITIAAKYTAVSYKNATLHIVDTPGHADFGGEVERALELVDGALLVVDPFEGVMTQTKFVVRKALQKGLKPLVVLNKVDRDGVTRALCDAVESDLFDLFAAMGADDAQLDFTVVYASARAGVASTSLEEAQKQIVEGNGSVDAILQGVLDHVPAPRGCTQQPFALLVSMIERDPFFGRLVTGRVFDGALGIGDTLKVLTLGDGVVRETVRVQKIFTSRNLERVAVKEAKAGDIVTIAAGFGDATVADTLCSPERREPLPSTPVDPPTLSMTFGVNTSSLAGKEGNQLTERQIEERLRAEADTDVSLRVSDSSDEDGIPGLQVSGRGELHLGIIIEKLRREGFELSVSPPRVIQGIDDEGRRTEPFENVLLECDANDCGGVIDAVTQRKGDLLDMDTNAGEDGRTRLTFYVPSRGLIGFRQEFINATRGNGVMQRAFDSYGPSRGAIGKAKKGKLISTTSGVTTTYSLGALEPRGTLFVGPASEVYAGMIIGEHTRENDLEVNPTKEKKLTNMRASGNDETIRLTPPKVIDLESAIGYVGTDELIEVTPKAIRLRKAELASSMRRRASRQADS
jgi:GTP-binding protein